MYKFALPRKSASSKRDHFIAYMTQAAEFAQQQLWDESSGRLRRSFCRNPSAVQGFADDYSYLISKAHWLTLDTYMATAAPAW